VLVVVAAVRVMPVTVVLEVNVVIMADRRVTATLAMLMPGVRIVHNVESTRVALVPVPLMLEVRVPLVHVIDMAGVIRGRVSARRRVRVLMLRVRGMFRGHKKPPFSALGALRRAKARIHCWIPL
jgi:hypothetical protein